MTRHINKVVVFCGASYGNDPAIRKQAEDLGRMLGAGGYELIYGGGDMGLMGVVARAAMAAGGKVRGIVPRIFHKSSAGSSQGEIEGVDEHVVETMLARKDKMILEADAGVALPGGYGSLDEIYEMAVVQELKIYAAPEAAIQPLLVVNCDGFYDGLVLQHKIMNDKGFLRPGRNELVQFVPDAAQAVAYLDDCNTRPPVLAKTLAPPQTGKASPPPAVPQP